MSCFGVNSQQQGLPISLTYMCPIEKSGRIRPTYIFQHPTKISCKLTCPNFNEACKWLLIAFCCENLLLQIAILEGMTNILCKSFVRCGQLVYTPRWCSHKIVMPHTMICFHIHASKLLQTQATRLYLGLNLFDAWKAS
jgi:hypothetical protein